MILKDTPEREYPLSNFLFISVENNILCHKCNKPLRTGEYVRLCSDYNKMFHRECLEGHSYINIVKTNGQLIHSDYLIIIKIIDKETFDDISAKELDLYV